MASPVEAHLILCDAARAENGKIHMLGAGWSLTSSPTAPHAVAVLMKVPWDRANQRLPLYLHLHEQDGALVTLPTPEGPVPVEARAEVEVGRPAGIAPGSMLDASFALNVQPLPLPPGRYTWHLDFAGSEQVAAFTVV